MKDKLWELVYEGRLIRVVNQLSLFPQRSSERLAVDGEVIARNNDGFLRLSAILRGTADIAGVESKRNGLTTECHVLVDDVLLGGDTKRKLQIPDFELTQKQLNEVAFAYLLKTGFLVYGLPFAIGVTLFNPPDNPWTGAMVFMFYVLLYAGIMGWVSWRSLKFRVHRGTLATRWSGRVDFAPRWPSRSKNAVLTGNDACLPM